MALLIFLKYLRFAELRFIHQEIGSLREENHKQNMEITSLKETVQLQNKTISQHESTIKNLKNNDHRMIKGDHPASPSAITTRRKRPARLIPYSILFGKKINNSSNEENLRQFYGPPTNCSDLSRLGYSLNGFYLVKNPLVDATFPQTTRIETVYCAFKQEGTYNPLNVQKAVIIPPPSSLSSCLPSNPDKNIFKTTKASGISNKNSSARMGYLINGFGKGIFPYGGSDKSNYTLHQEQADFMSWSWNESSLGSGDRHLCNSLGKCATSYNIDPIVPNGPSFIRQDDYYMNKEAQKFYFVELPAYLGFFIIKDEFGQCVAIYGNTDRIMAEVRAMNCNPSEAGQRWKWSYP